MKSSYSGTVKARLEEELKEAKFTLPRYLVVAIVSTAIGTAVLWCFTVLVGLYYLVSGCLGAFFTILSAFVFNELWTFSHRRAARLFTIELAKRFARFILSKTAGFLICIGILAFFTQVVGWHYLISNIFAIGASFAWNYTVSSLWVWARKERRG